MKRTLVLCFWLIFAVCCEKNNYKTFSTKYRVFFSCNIADAPFNGITTPGRFLSARVNNGKLMTVDSDGKKENITLTAVQNGSFIMGLGGLIIGTPTFNNDNVSIWAYDLGCPECDQLGVRLTFDIQGIASCSSCQGQWNMNSSGISVNTDGKERRPLYRYPTSLNDGILVVSN